MQRIIFLLTGILTHRVIIVMPLVMLFISVHGMPSQHRKGHSA